MSGSGDNGDVGREQRRRVGYGGREARRGEGGQEGKERRSRWLTKRASAASRLASAARDWIVICARRVAHPFDLVFFILLSSLLIARSSSFVVRSVLLVVHGSRRQNRCSSAEERRVRRLTRSSYFSQAHPHILAVQLLRGPDLSARFQRRLRPEQRLQRRRRRRQQQQHPLRTTMRSMCPSPRRRQPLGGL